MAVRLREIRENNYLTQREVAKLLKISKTTYNYFETGERIIPLKHLNNFCNNFDVSADYVFHLTDDNVIFDKKAELNKQLIGLRVKEIRIKNNMKQHELASIFNTSQSTVSAYENGYTLILTAFVYALCKELNISMDYIIGRSNVKNINIK